MNDIIESILAYAKNDFRAHPVRFVLEMIAWVTSITCSIIMALTIPHPPFLLLYPMFIAQCAVFGWAAWSRRSFGMLGNYALMVSIDCIALARLILG